MKFFRVLLICISVIAFTFCKVGNISAANENTPVYMFGIVTSFNDSVLYMSQVQLVDSAYTDKKNKFLYSRENYSYQLKNYIKSLGVENPTCITVYGFKKNKIEKKYSKIRKKFAEKDKYLIKYLAADEFKFSPIIPSEITSQIEEMDEPKGKKKEKKTKK